MVPGLLLALLLQTQAAAPPVEHEYTDARKFEPAALYAKAVSEIPVTDEEKKELKQLFQFSEFVGKSSDGRDVNFHLPTAEGHKPAPVVILSYLAEWCGNSNYQIPYLRDLYTRYGGKGLQIVGRSEYSEVEKMNAVVEKNQLQFPIITGSIPGPEGARAIRLQTFHYMLRSMIGDRRNWGTPLSIIILNGDLENPYVVAGEMKAEQVEPLIESVLGN
jgi:hypothetical protein